MGKQKPYICSMILTMISPAKVARRFVFAGLMLLTSAVCLLNSAQGQGQPADQRNFEMTGTVGQAAENQWAAIIDPQKGSYVGSPARITNRSFRLSAGLPAAQPYVLMIGDPQQQQSLKYFNIFLANEEVVVQVDDSFQRLTVSKGANAIAFQALVQELGPDFEALNNLEKMKAAAGTYQYNTDSLNEARGQVLARIKEKVPVFLKAHSQSMVAPFLLNLIWPLNFPLAEVEAWAALVSPQAMASDYGQAFADLVGVEKMLGYGQSAPLFVQNDPEGKPVSLENFKGKYVLIDFWASWCGPCRMENPNVVRAYERYKAKNFTVLGVSLDKDRNKWLQAITDDKLTWTHVSDLGFWNNAVAKLYRVSSIPQNYLLDPEGKIIGKNLRGEELSGFLEKVLANN